MARKSFPLLLFTTGSLFSVLGANAQTISTDTPVPPLQWINLSGLLQGSSSPPPLKNAAIGYDEASRSLIIFGGESATGLVQSQTFLLNLDSLTWSVPNPPNNLHQIPAARSAAIYGIDIAASNRQGFIVAGGMGSDGRNLTDVWEYDFINKFWSEVNVTPGPLPRWGSAGGIDLATPPIPDPIVPGPNNTFYLAGGYNGIHPSSLSDVWRLNISGTLSSNLPDGVSGSWDHLTIGNLPAKFNVSSTVVGHQVVITGGCSSLSQEGTCAGEQDSYVIDAQRLTATPLSACPAPRAGPVLVRNSNGFTPTFMSQVYLLLGTLDKTRWNDDNGLDQGEVAVLDIQTGVWSRILPSGDPGTSGEVAFPSPREGSAAISYPQALVGSERNISSDTLIFGGQDSSGMLLSEMWLLRAYNGLIDPSQPIWSGFGDGHLQTGANATGAGVSVKYMTQCASEIMQNPTSTSHPTTSATTVPTATVSIVPSPSQSGFNTSVVHKVLSPVSLATFQAAFLLFRSLPLYHRRFSTIQAFYSSAVLLILAYGSGIAGLVIAFISISQDPRQGNLHLRTGHGIASLIFFALLYVVLPVLLLLYGYSTNARARVPAHDSESEKDKPPRTIYPESLQTYDRISSKSAPQSLRIVSSSPSSPRHRTNSWGPSGVMYRNQESRISSDSDLVRSSSPKRGFEVLNRPPRTRGRTSSLAFPTVDNTQERLREMDWLQRRRSLNTVGELDYALSQQVRREQLSTPATTDDLMVVVAPLTSQPQLEIPTVSEMMVHAIIQGLFLGLSILTLMILWTRVHKYGFAIFLAWTVVFYVVMIYCALFHQPGYSFLSALCSLQHSPARNMTADPTPPPSLREVNSGPYVHQPSHRVADEISLSQGGQRSTETEEDDIDVEMEMRRRDVSIITIPRRKLWIANP